jgi:hypothetical protein
MSKRVHLSTSAPLPTAQQSGKTGYVKEASWSGIEVKVDGTPTRLNRGSLIDYINSKTLDPTAKLKKGKLGFGRSKDTAILTAFNRIFSADAAADATAATAPAAPPAAAAAPPAAAAAPPAAAAADAKPRRRYSVPNRLPSRIPPRTPNVAEIASTTAQRTKQVLRGPTRPGLNAWTATKLIRELPDSIEKTKAIQAHNTRVSKSLNENRLSLDTLLLDPKRKFTPLVGQKLSQIATRLALFIEDKEDGKVEIGADKKNLTIEEAKTSVAEELMDVIVEEQIDLSFTVNFFITCSKAFNPPSEHSPDIVKMIALCQRNSSHPEDRVSPEFDFPALLKNPKYKLTPQSHQKLLLYFRKLEAENQHNLMLNPHLRGDRMLTLNLSALEKYVAANPPTDKEQVQIQEKHIKDLESLSDPCSFSELLVAFQMIDWTSDKGFTSAGAESTPTKEKERLVAAALGKFSQRHEGTREKILAFFAPKSGTIYNYIDENWKAPPPSPQVVTAPPKEEPHIAHTRDGRPPPEPWKEPPPLLPTWAEDVGHETYWNRLK